MGRLIKDNSVKAGKNRARVRKSRLLKQRKEAHESHIREEMYSMEQIYCENLCKNIDDLSDKRENDEDNEYLQYDRVDKSIEFMDKLRFWAIHHRITQTAISDLLKILIFGGFSFLPKDSRTFMKTPREVEISKVSNGKLWYYGIQKCLQSVMPFIRCSDSVTLDFSFDGLPIFKSSNLQFWPMLFSLQGNFQHKLKYFFDMKFQPNCILNRVSLDTTYGLWNMVRHFEASIERIPSTTYL